jgi:leader peptidase (prepilin peptidase)/N-methyltransferase
MPATAGLVAVCGFALGAVVGSFLNVVIYRLPRGQSVVFPASHCPACLRPLCVWQNLPLLSWLCLGGRCAACKAPIPWRYPLVELLGGVLFALALLEFGLSLQALFACVLSASLIAVTFIDLDHLLILDAITVPTAAAGLAFAVLSRQLTSALEGALFGLVLLGVIYVATRGAGLGLGDVKLAAAAGLYLGLGPSIAAVLGSFVIGSLVALPVLVLRKRGRREALPFGPFLVLALLLALFAPAALVGPFHAYQSFIAQRTYGGP